MNLPKLRYIILPCAVIALASCRHKAQVPPAPVAQQQMQIQQAPVQSQVGSQSQIYSQNIGISNGNTVVLQTTPQGLLYADVSSVTSPTPINYAIVYASPSESEQCKISTWNNKGEKITSSQIAGTTFTIDNGVNKIIQIDCDKETNFQVTTTFSISDNKYIGSSELTVK